MAQKTKKWEEFITLGGEAVKVVSYADYFARRPLFSALQIKNTAGEAAEGLTLTIENENGMLVPFEKNFEEIPFESTVSVEAGNLLSPLYFANADEAKEETITAVLKKDKKILAQQSWTVTPLPFDFWQGTEGNPEILASFVRPRLADCAKIRDSVVEQLKKWGADCQLGEFGGGYIGNDKNAVRRIIAALYASLRRLSVTKKEADISRPVEAGAGVKILSERKASVLEMAIFACSCLESFGLHSLLIFGERNITCGVWLIDSCFLDTVSDDTERLNAYASDGINNVSCFDAEDLFSDRNAAYSTSEAHFKQKLDAGVYYDRYVDIRRCRISHVLPLPLRARNVKGYEVLSEEATSPFHAPSELKDPQDWGLGETEQTKDKQWERRLLDLSMKNALLHFQPNKGGVQLVSADPDETLDAVTAQKELLLAPATFDIAEIAQKGVKFGATAEARSMRELISIENRSGVLRTYADEKTLTETVGRLIRKNKEADEEYGTKILYLALGFLKWYSREDGEEHFAPLVLQPVTLKKGKGGLGYALTVSDEDVSVNSTLLEYLNQEFNIDVRGLDGAVQGLKISEVLAMIRMEIVRMRGWEVYDDTYLAAFSFARYQMWHDLRRNIGEFSKNEIIDAFLNNSLLLGGDERLNEDEVRPETTLTPLPADASQWGAIALSQKGKSFVLHGPPGTGKSQTITNIIANALYDEKRVLFVAEKQAALSVVKKRLDSLGLGDFCLELHSNKTNKTEVLQKLSSTLSLAGGQERVSLTEKASNIVKLKEDLSEPLIALHKKRRLGVSVYEALLICLKNKNAPEIMNIESSFYDGLTKEKIDAYERMMIQAGAFTIRLLRT